MIPIILEDYSETIAAEDLLIFKSLDMKAPSCDNCSSEPCQSCESVFDEYVYQLLQS